MTHDTKVSVLVALLRTIGNFVKYRHDPYFKTEIKKLIKAYREVFKI